MDADPTPRDFDLWRWQHYPVRTATEQPALQPPGPSRATGRARACVLHHHLVYDEGYVVYAYRWAGEELGFAWGTGFDEVHRAWSLDGERPHDVLVHGFVFDVAVDPRAPHRHRAVDLRLLDAGVHWLDPALA